MRKVLISVNGKQFDVELLHRDGNALSFICNGQSYTTTIASHYTPTIQEGASIPSIARPTPSQKTSAPKAQNGEVPAPMPGIVVSIPVKQGQTISAGDTVAVIEAMKMENNIRAAQSGTIAEILVKSGDEVSHGQLLLKVASN